MTKRNKEKEKKTLRGVPVAPTPSFHLEADRSTRGMSVILSGIIGISDFSDSNIALQSHGGRISINGKKLFICVYDGGSVEIVGKVEEIVFKYGKN